MAVDEKQIKEPIISCEQCGTCSSACPVTGVEGFNIRRIEHGVQLNMIGIIAETGVQWVCTMCGRCEEVCPNGYEIMTTTRGLRKLTPADLMPIVAPCKEACPAGIDAPLYVRLIAEGKPQEAYAVIRETVPFPAILGRVCQHPCEEACKRGAVNQPISICALKRYAADKTPDLPPELAEKAPATGKKVAIVGSGPAGLTAAFYLKKKGHDVTVFEADPKPGGMMRYGIPYSRLPEVILDKEIKDVLDLGVELKTNSKLGESFTIDDLKAQGYEAVFLAVGAQKSTTLGVGNADSEGLVDGLTWLKDVKLGKEVNVGKRVAVVGGGNVAIDVARSAVRMGAESVTVVYRRTANEMPALKSEVEEAEKEGVTFHYLAAPQQIVLGSDAACSGLECLQTELGEPDESGRRRPVAVSGSEFVVEADMVVSAVGQVPDVSCLSAGQCELTPGLTVKVDAATLATSSEGVYAGGDFVTGAATVIEAIAAGRRAAGAIDKALGGNGDIEQRLWKGTDGFAFSGRREPGFADLRRCAEPALAVEERLGGFTEVALGFTDEEAVAEAKRCLLCDLEINMARNGSSL